MTERFSQPATSLLDLFRLLADAERIKIMASVMDRALSTEEIAGQLGLPAKRVAQQVARLRHAGLIETRNAAHRFCRGPLQEALRATAEAPPPPAELSGDLPQEDQRVLANYLAGGRLKAIPAQQKKRDVILRFLAEQFEPNRMYGEREVNDLIKPFHDDYASLRRWLVDTGLLQRQVVRVIEKDALIRGTPEVDHQIMYWKPS